MGKADGGNRVERERGRRQATTGWHTILLVCIIFSRGCRLCITRNVTYIHPKRYALTRNATPRIQITRHIISKVKKLFLKKKVRWWAGVEIITKGAVRVQSTHINGRCIDCFPFGGGRAMALVRCKHFSSPGREFFSSLPGPCCYSTT